MVLKWFFLRPWFFYPKLYGFLGYHRKKGRRREMEALFRLVDSRWGRQRIERIVRSIFELRGLKKMNRRLIPLIDGNFVERFVKAEGLDHLDRALKEGRGVVLMSAHFGNPHLSINAMRAMGYPVKVLKGGVQRRAKPSRFEYYETWENTVFLHDPSMSMEEKKKRILHILASGGILYQMADAAEGRKKAEVLVFGRPMGFPTGLIHLAHQAGAALLPLFHFYEGGRLELVVHERVENRWAEGEEGYGRIVSRYAKLLESNILRHPGQYIGIYGPTVINAHFRPLIPEMTASDENETED